MQSVAGAARILSFFVLFHLAAATLVSAGNHKGPFPPGARRTAAPSAKNAEFAADELIVKFKPGVTAQKKQNLHVRHGGRKLREWTSLRMQHVKLKQGDKLQDALQRYRLDPEVEYAEPNYLVHANSAPNDPRFSSLWGMQKIAAPAAWSYHTGSQEVVVAVIDSGIDYNHPDLLPNLWLNPGEIAGNHADDDGNGYVDDLHGINAINRTGDSYDDNGHGTHVAGTIGAAGNNSLGVVGVNWSVRIVACKFLGANGSGYVSDAVQCLEYVRALKDQGVNIVATNNSWGGGGYSQALYDAIAAQQDILFIAAAGNESTDNDKSPHYPSSYDLPNVISVAATDSDDVLAPFSNYGRYSVDLAAPGVEILSTLPPSNDFGISGGYGILSGTSMATPHVTGLAALLKAQDPARQASQIKNLIFSGGDDAPLLAGKSITGKRLNAFGSLSGNNRSVLSLGWLPSHLTLGNSYPLTAYSVDRELPAPVTVTGSDGTALTLADTGVAPDVFAGDGVFSGIWTPATLPVTLTFSSAGGSKSVTLSDLAVAGYIADASQDVPYSQPLRASGGTPPYTWSITAGTLPAGLILDPGTGVVSGTATLPGSSSFVVQVTDAKGHSSLESFSLRVDGAGFTDQKWGGIYDSSAQDRALGTATDAAGDSYVVGESFNGKDMDLILRKYDAEGRLLWSRSYDGGSYDSGRSVALDRSTGEVYVAGVSGLPGDHLLLKYDASGNLLWKKSWNRGGDDMAWGVATGPAGVVYTVGTVETADGGRILLTKIDPAGTTLWTRLYQNPGPGYPMGPWDEYGYSVAVDGSGNIYLGGTRIWVYNSSQSSQLVIAKFDPAGNLLWSKSPFLEDLTLSNVIKGVAVDAAGNVYATGWMYAGRADRDGPIPQHLAGRTGVILKLDAAGNTLWSTELFHWCESVAVSGDKAYLACQKDDAIQLARLDLSGKLLWSRPLDPGGVSAARGIAADDAGFSVCGFRDNGVNDDLVAARYAEAAPHNDLSVREVSGASSPGNLFYSALVRNSGSGNPFAKVWIYLSPGDAPTSYNYFVNQLPAQQFPAGVDTVVSGSTGVQASIPSGSYYLKIYADAFNALNETDKSNNWALGPLVTLNCDLAVTDVAATVNGGVLSYTVTVENRGQNQSAATTTALQFSSGSASYLVTSVGTPEIAPAKETVLIGSAAVPAGIPPGSFAVTAVADPGNTIYDANLVNNRGVGNTVTLPVDLTVTALSGTLNAGKLSYTAKVRNDGLQTVSPALALYFSPDASASTDDRLLTQVTLDSIAGGAEGSVTGTVDLPAGIPSGSYYLAALVDPANAIVETNESNNGRVGGSFAIGGPRPALNYTLTGTGSGTVTFVPGGSCAGSCSQSYDAGTSVTLSAVPAAGSSFAGWGGACTGTGSCTLAIDGDRAVSASFVKKPALSYAPLGAGTGTVTFEPGASCTGACVQPFDPGTLVTLAAVPGPGSAFKGWTGACSGTGSCTVSADADRAVFATFQPVIPAISAGIYHTVAQTGGTVWSWGSNAQGQLGDGTNDSRLVPRQVPELAGFASLAVGHDAWCTMGLRTDGTLWSWGSNYYGQLGDGSNTNRNVMVQASGLTQVIAATGGVQFSATLRGDGTVWTWGVNNRGQMGDGTNTPYPFLPSRTVPLPVPGLTEVVALGGGEESLFALKADGTVWAWGANQYGALGNGSTASFIASPVLVPGLSDLVAISGGEVHTVALKKDGTVWAWGYNYQGELGDGTTTSRSTPARVQGLTGVVAIAAGYHHTLALKSDGTVWAWGWNNLGELGNGRSGSGTQALVPVKVAGLDNVAAIAAGGEHNVAVKTDASIWTWGDNRYGQLGDGTMIDRNAPVRVYLDVAAPATTATPAAGSYDAPVSVTLSANEPATIYYTLDGSTPTTASRVYSAPVTVSATATLRYFAQDSGGNREAPQAQSYLIGVSGAPTAEFTASASSGDAPLTVSFSDLSSGAPGSWLWDFGDNSTSTAQNPVHSYASAGSYPVTLTVTSAAGSGTKTRADYILVKDPAHPAVIGGLTAGNGHSGVLMDGRIATWGNNYFGQLGDPNSTGRSVPVFLGGLSGLTALAAGSNATHALVAGADGSVFAWGYNNQGEVGDGSIIQRNAPVALTGLPPQIAQLSVGLLSSMALGKDGTVWSWGLNSYGKLGDGTTTGRRTPVQVIGLPTTTAIAAGGQHGMALASDQTVWTWGYDWYGQLGDGGSAARPTPARVPGLSGVIAIAGGYYHSVALKADGTVWTWGANWLGQIGDGSTANRGTPFQVPGISGVVAIAAGQAFTVALKADGSVWAWGDNGAGELGDGTKVMRTAPVQVAGLSGVTRIAAGLDHVLAQTQDGTLWAWGANGYGQLGDGTKTGRSTPVRVAAIDSRKPATTAYPPGGSYAAPQSVTLTVNKTASIYYTLDGSTPTTSSAVYTAPLSIGFSTTLRYFAKDPVGNIEAVSTQVYRIAATGAPTADFGASASTGNAPFSVQFSDLSTGAPASWLWNFGDATTSTLKNPVHVYGAPGVYTVSLTVGNTAGTDTRTLNGFITALDPGPSPLQPAYNSAVDGALLRVRAGLLVEDPVFDRNIAVKIGGGYDFLYRSTVGATILRGGLRVKDGTVSLDGLTFQ